MAPLIRKNVVCIDRRRVVNAMAFGLILLAFIVDGHDGKRVAQLGVLALPVCAWLLMDLRHPAWVAVRMITSMVIGASFVADGVIRDYLFDAYQAAPESAMVLTAVANSSPNESAEFFTMYWTEIVTRTSAAVLGVAALAWVCNRGAWTRAIRTGTTARSDSPSLSLHRYLSLAMLAALFVLCVVAFASKPWRSHYPLFFWANWAVSANSLRGAWEANEADRSALLASASKTVKPLPQGHRATVVLAIGESINRSNLGIYGYARDTTPELAKIRALHKSFKVVGDAWSSEATTVPSLQSMLNVRGPDGSHQHIIALARAAGYKVWWIANQDDVAITNEHGLLADTFVQTNRVPGRSSQELDEAVIAPFQEALQDDAARKFIIVHLIGAHPRYQLRYEGASPFVAKDAVDAAMHNAGRTPWIVSQRRDYDAAVRYHDGVLSTLFGKTAASGHAGDSKTWLYLSDHGQDVGHQANHAGHSPSTTAGYQIPFMVWRQGAAGSPWPDDLERRSFRADWLSMTLSNALKLTWTGYVANQDILSDSYEWKDVDVIRSLN